MEVLDQKEVSVGEWILTILLTAIPLIGFIMLFIWAFGGNTKPSKSNWAKATLIWFAVMIFIYVFIAIVFGAALLTLADGFN